MNGIVIIPTYNEAANLEPLIHRILSQPIGLDILVVDDNSPDGTGDLADRIAKTGRRLAAGSASCIVRVRKVWAVPTSRALPGRSSMAMRF